MIRPRLPFSLGEMMLAVTVISVLTAAVAAEPGGASGAIVSLLVIVVPAVALAGSLACRGYARAFWVGATSPALAAALAYLYSMSFGFSLSPPSGTYGGFLDSLANTAVTYRPLLVILWCSMPVVGLLCLVSQFFLDDSD